MSSVHSEFTIDRKWITYAATGGAVLGGGGGGALEEGIRSGKLAIDYGNPSLRSIESIPEDEYVLTVSAVGAPAATNRHVKPRDYVRAVELTIDRFDDQESSIAALMTNEMGGNATTNGFLQSAVTGLPVVDAACNGRAHPTGAMGSMGLAADTQSLQVAVGGDPSADRYVEVVVEASLQTAADTIRQAAEDAAGLVAVARNPVTASYVRDNAATNVYEQAVTIGKTVANTNDGLDAAHKVANQLGGSVPVAGTVEEVTLQTEGGFDVGTVAIEGSELTFWNEFMTVEQDNERLATFPDLIAAIDTEIGAPVTTATIRPNQTVAVIVAPAEALSLGAGMYQPDLFEPVEAAIEESVVEYAFPSEANGR